MLAMKYILPSKYNQLINRRETSENYLSGYTATLITDVFDNTSHLVLKKKKKTMKDPIHFTEKLKDSQWKVLCEPFGMLPV